MLSCGWLPIPFPFIVKLLCFWCSCWHLDILVILLSSLNSVTNVTNMRAYRTIMATPPMTSWPCISAFVMKFSGITVCSFAVSIGADNAPNLGSTKESICYMLLCPTLVNTWCKVYAQNVTSGSILKNSSTACFLACLEYSEDFISVIMIKKRVFGTTYLSGFVLATYLSLLHMCVFFSYRYTLFHSWMQGPCCLGNIWRNVTNSVGVGLLLFLFLDNILQNNGLI